MATKKWYRLDNAGVLYSALQKETYSAIYRFSAVMREQVDPAALQRAIDKTMPRFPGFAVCIKKGVFWYYLEPNTKPGPFLKQDILYPCQPVRFREDNGWLIRFYYYERRISLEVFHALSDGAGSIIFFRTLLAVYLRELGHAIPNEGGVLDINEKPDPGELEDAYAKNAGSTARAMRLRRRAYPNTGTPEPFYTLNVTMGFVSVAQLKARAKAYGASITEYLAAVQMKVILERQRYERPNHQLPVALVIPVNLRAFFPTKTLRNFMLTLSPSIDPTLGEYSFEEIVAHIRHYLRLHINRHELQAAFTHNVNFQKNRLLQLVPITLKNPVMALNYRFSGARPYSGNYSNPGQFTVPPEMEPHIEHIEIVVGQAMVPRSHCVSISYGDIMEITFAGTQKENDMAREVFRFLVREGISVKVTSNDYVERGG